MKLIIKKIIKTLFSLTGTVTKYFFRRNQILILAYHDVNDKNLEDPFCIDEKLFEKHITWLEEKGYEIISISQIVENVKKDAHHAKQIALSFDDGFKNHLRVVAPLLKRKGMNATFFCSIEMCKENQQYNRQFLKPNEIRKLSKLGFDIQNHTYSHGNFQLLNKKDTMKEVSKGQQKLRELTKKKIDLFCSPGSGNNKYLKKIIKETKHEYFIHNCYPFNTTLQFDLSRKTINNSSLKEFTSIIKGRMDLFFYSYHILRKLLKSKNK